MPVLYHPVDPPRFDAAWLFLIAGIGALAAAVLMPAHDDLASARHARDIALIQEGLHQERLDRYQRYLQALDAEHPRLITSLAASQLNLVPDGARPLSDLDCGLPASASVLGALEPEPVPAPTRANTGSMLERLTLGPSRTWLLGAGGICLLIGLIPPPDRR